MIPKPIRVTTTEKYKIHLLYSDGIEGEVDLSHLKGKGVFKEWDKNNLFEKVYIDKELNSIAWSETIELCPDAIYLKIVGKTFDQWKEENSVYAAD